MRLCFKRVSNAAFRILLFPVWLFVAFGDWLLHSHETYLLFAHCFALFPGKLGEFLRRAYYEWTLAACGTDLVIGFGSFLTSREVNLGHGVWIGQYSIIGKATIASRVLISDHVSVLTGRHHHVRDAAGQLIVNENQLAAVSIGQDSWIGAGAVVMAAVGEQAVVGAGAVVVKPVPRQRTVVGVPTRVVESRPQTS